jgi:hypothetical protein
VDADQLRDGRDDGCGCGAKLADAMTAPKLPKIVEEDLVDSAREVIGRGYVEEYYTQIGSNFLWLYEFGYERAIRDLQNKKRRKQRKSKSNK